MPVFTLNIITPQGFFYQGEACELIVPAVEGRMGVLAHHAEIIAALSAGDVEIRTPQEEDRLLTIQSGCLMFASNKCTLLAIV